MTIAQRDCRYSRMPIATGHISTAPPTTLLNSRVAKQAHSRLNADATQATWRSRLSWTFEVLTPSPHNGHAVPPELSWLPSGLFTPPPSERALSDGFIPNAKPAFGHPVSAAR